MDTPKYDIFISYRHLYIQWVESLYINLIEQGYRVFLDNHSLEQGRPIEEKIYDCINQVKHFIVIATNDITSNDSKWVPKECLIAETLQKKNKLLTIHPLVFNQNLPEMPFQQEHFLINFSLNDEANYRQQIRTLFSSLEGRKSPQNEEFAGWLDIPEQSIYKIKDSNPSISIKKIEEKSRLAKCFSHFRSVDSVDNLDSEVILKLHTELNVLIKSRNGMISRQALLLLCLLHNGHAQFYRGYLQLGGLQTKKISDLIKKVQILDSDKERLKGIGCANTLKSKCKATIK